MHSRKSIKLSWPLRSVLCMAVFGITASSHAAVPELNTAYNFTGYNNGDDFPGLGDFEVSSLVQAADGQLYGVAAYGGTSSLGMVFKLDPTTGKLTQLHNFGYTDGAIPRGGLTLGSDGNLYGTTESGGSNQSDYCLVEKYYNKAGCGTAFKITPKGIFTKLHDFYSAADNYLSTPNTGMVQAGDGNFYGLAAQPYPTATNVIFKLTPAGAISVLYTFPNDNTQGYQPNAGLTVGRDGWLYGTMSSFGGSGGNGGGTVFKVSLAGQFQLLHVFGNGNSGDVDGASPTSSLLQASDGNFYGTTKYGGHVAGVCVYGGCGTIYKITPDGTETVLFRFTGTSSDGEYPQGAGLIQLADGSFYGVAGGNPYGEGYSVPLCYLGPPTPFGCGIVYQFDGQQSLTVLHTFGEAVGMYGLWPHASLMQASDGNLYGTTFSGGGYGPGTIYRLLLNTATPVIAIGGFSPAGGAEGSQVTFTGRGFTGASRVQFVGPIDPNSAALTWLNAKFTVISDTQITATVPQGAISAVVGITSPLGTEFSPDYFFLTPIISSFSPLKARVGGSVTVLGQHFNGLGSITFGGVPATNWIINSDTSVTVTVPKGAQSGAIAITNPGGTATSSQSFTVRSLSRN